MTDWKRLSLFSRRAALDILAPSRRIETQQLGPHLEPLIEVGLIEPVPSAATTSVAVPRARQPLIRLLKALDRVRTFEPATQNRLEIYLREHFTQIELAALGNGYRGNNLHRAIASRVAESRWLADFLEAPDAVEWEWQRSDERLGWRFVSDDLVNLTRRLLHELLEANSPIPITELVERIRETKVAPQLLGKAFATSLRYALAFVSMRSGDLEPVAALWPSAASRIRRPPVAAPTAATKIQGVFAANLGVLDFATILAGCAADPIRLRSDDLAIFKRDRQMLSTRLAPVPDWLASHARFSDDVRLDTASWELRRFGLAEIKNDKVLAATPKGSEWLAKTVGEQLGELVLAIRARGLADRSSEPNEEASPLFLPRIVHPYLVDHATLVEAVIEPFDQLEVGKFFAVNSFLDHCAQAANPLRDWTRRRSVGYWYPERSDLAEEELEAAWKQQLAILLFYRLVPFGGAQLGLLADGTIAFALTANGRYLFGSSQSFSAHSDRQQGDIFVQPNFEVVFMAPAPAAEADIGRFAERVRSSAAGLGVGVLFRLTREAALRAAATGVAAETAIATLTRIASTAVPQNVEAQLESWFNSCRHVDVENTTVIRCRDLETATRALAIGKGAVRAISETVLELSEPSRRAAYLKALRREGIFPR